MTEIRGTVEPDQAAEAEFWQDYLDREDEEQDRLQNEVSPARIFLIVVACIALISALV